MQHCCAFSKEETFLKQASEEIIKLSNLLYKVVACMLQVMLHEDEGKKYVYRGPTVQHVRMEMNQIRMKSYSSSIFIIFLIRLRI
jgi:hypothetical protein